MATQPTATGFDFNRPTIVSLLYLVGIITAVPTLVAVVLAYMWRGDTHEAWGDSHYRYHIRTFWIGPAYGLLGFVTMMIGVGFIVLALLPVWMAIRSIVSLGAAQRRSRVHNATSWLW